MEKEKFKKWLQLRFPNSEAVVRDQISRCKRIEKYYGDLNNLSSSKCQSLISDLTYTVNDERENRKPRHIIPIDGNYSPFRAETNPGYIGSYAMDATAMALHCVWTTNSAKDAVLKAVNMCGDADSVGAVTGQIAGAAYGFSDFPKDWISTVNRWDNHEIGLRAFRLYHKIWKN
ncbi:MAG: ADP-ribosylglycohydrolase family protein [Prevotellaceae bacterium]|nr:ADP-ribosylglycohydrolase family protein [Prevotellaceae bacterium]